MNSRYREFLVSYDYYKDTPQHSTWNNTSLHKACKSGNFKVVKMLLEDPHIKKCLLIRDNDNNTPLHYACMNRNPEITEKLLEYSYTRDCLQLRNNFDDTPLHIACWYNNSKVVKILLGYLQCRACLYVFNRYRDTPLHSACMYKYTEVVKILLPLYSLSFIKSNNVYYQQYIKDLIYIVNSKTFACTLININVRQYLENSYYVLYLLLLIAKPRDVNYLIENSII